MVIMSESKTSLTNTEQIAKIGERTRFNLFVFQCYHNRSALLVAGGFLNYQNTCHIVHIDVDYVYNVQNSG